MMHMSDDDAETAPTVSLGADEPVDGAPIARVAARLHYPLPRSQLVARAGEIQIRTPAGPTTLATIIEETDAQIFPTAAALISTVRESAGDAPAAAE
jgi:hypothetical protein